MQTDLGQPRPRHQYTYHPRPYPGQKGVLTYSGPLNLTAATQGYGYGGYGGYGAYGYGAGYGTAAYGAYGAAPVGGSSITYRRVSNTVTPGATALVTTTGTSTAQCPTTTTCNAVVPCSNVHCAYVAAATPTATCTHPTTCTTTTKCATHAHTHRHTPCHAHAHHHEAAVVVRNPTPTAEDIRLENRRVATERGAYKPRKIKPADAKPDDMFWCRERDGEWHCRPYYQIEDHCYPGIWQMDAEHGFLVFHRE